jgi:hypothetical protein
MGFFERIKNNETRIYKYAVPKKMRARSPFCKVLSIEGKVHSGLKDGSFVVVKDG